MWCAHSFILWLQVAGLTAAATTKNENANLNLDKVFRTPKDYSKVNFDHFEIVERNNFGEEAAAATLSTPTKEAVQECTDDKTGQKTKCIANANAKITVRFGGGDKQYFYGPPPRTLPGILPLPTITALHEGYFHPYLPPPRGAYPIFYPGFADVQEESIRYKPGRNYDEPFYSRVPGTESGQHITKKRKTTLSDINDELSTTPKDSSSINDAKVLHIGDKATTIPNAILFTSTCKDGETNPTGIPDVIVHTVYPSKDDESVTEPTKNHQSQHSAIQLAPDDSFFKGHPKILKAWMLKKKGLSDEKIEEVTNATDSIYNEALKKIGAILLHLQAGGDKECKKDDLDTWLNASLVPYRCKGCDCERSLLVSYPINGENKDVECICSEDSSVCSCKPCLCGECSRDPSIPFGKRFRADEDMLHKITKQIKLNELPSIDPLKHPKAKAVLHSKGNGVNAVDDQISPDTKQLDKRVFKRETDLAAELNQKRDEVEVAKLAATEPTPRKFVPGSDQINQSDAPQLDKHLAKREDIPFGGDEQKRDEVEVAKLAATEPTPRKFVPGSDQINQSEAPPDTILKKAGNIFWLF